MGMLLVNVMVALIGMVKVIAKVIDIVKATITDIIMANSHGQRMDFNHAYGFSHVLAEGKALAQTNCHGQEQSHGQCSDNGSGQGHYHSPGHGHGNSHGHSNDDGYCYCHFSRHGLSLWSNVCSLSCPWS